MTVEQSRTHQLAGRILADKFRLRACVGVGGSGAVYKADQIALGRTVAVKILSEELATDARLVKRFHDEALAASRLNHPNTVSVIDYGQSLDGLLYLVMEYLQGPTLTQLVSRGVLDHDRVVDIIGQVLSGLEEAHLAGVVHADVKSDNIIIDQRRSGRAQVKVVDFGIARLVNAPRGEGDDRNICGTPEYMAPELISGAAPSVSSDLYATGVVLYELLTGETPFVGGTAIDVLSRHLKVEPVPPSERRPERTIPTGFDTVCARALAKHPGDRYATAAEMRAAVLALRERVDTDAVACAACGAVTAVRFRFCPECGQPRIALEHTTELPAAVVHHEIEREASTAGVLPLPLVGRSDVLAALIGYLAGRQREPLLQLVGRSGAGKSRLLAEAYTRVASTANVTIFQSGPDPSGLASPFYPIRAVAAAVLGLPAVCPIEELERAALGLGLTRRDVPGIAELFGQPAQLGDLEPPIRRRELIASTLRLLRVAAEAMPMALVFEEIERFDHPSQEVLRRLAERDDDANMPVVVTNGVELAGRWPTGTARLDLVDLDDEALGTIASHLVRTLPAAAAAGAATPVVSAVPDGPQLRELTGGLPAHVDHLVRYLVEVGSLEGAPQTLPDLVASRISLLPHPSLVLCQTAAAFGLDVDRAILRHATGMELDGTFDRALAALISRGLLHDDGVTVGFVSPLVRDVTYDATPADVRRALHEVAADLLISITSEPAVLGHHHDLAGRVERAATLLERGGDDAAHQLDDAGAAQLYQRALTAARRALYRGDDDATRRFVVLSVKLADTLRVCGEIGLARGVVEEASSWADGSPELLALLARASAHLALVDDDVAGAAGHTRRAIGLAMRTGQGAMITDLYLDLATIHLRAGEPEVARRELEEAVDTVTLGEGATARSGPEALWRLLMRLAQLHSAAGDVSGALHLGECALMHARRVSSRLGSARLQSMLAAECERAGQHDKAERYRVAAVEEMRHLGDRRGTAELLLAGTRPTRTLVRISTSLASEARDLAAEVGWVEGVARATAVTDEV